MAGSEKAEEMQVKRQKVDYRYDALNWEFIKLLAEIANYAGEKYDRPEQYTNGRLTGDKSPINHIAEHTRMYLMDEPHDHFGTLKHQLAAIAYNAMMEFFYLESTGPTARHLFAGPITFEEALDIAHPPRPKEEVVEISPIIDNDSPFRRHAMAQAGMQNANSGNLANVLGNLGKCSGPLPGNNVTAVQTEDKTVFITNPETTQTSTQKLLQFFRKS